MPLPMRRRDAARRLGLHEEPEVFKPKLKCSVRMLARCMVADERDGAGLERQRSELCAPVQPMAHVQYRHPLQDIASSETG